MHKLRRICYELYDHRWFIMCERAHQATKIRLAASGEQLPTTQIDHESLSKDQAPNNIYTHKKYISSAGTVPLFTIRRQT